MTTVANPGTYADGSGKLWNLSLIPGLTACAILLAVGLAMWVVLFRSSSAQVTQHYIARLEELSHDDDDFDNNVVKLYAGLTPSTDLDGRLHTMFSIEAELLGAPDAPARTSHDLESGVQAYRTITQQKQALLTRLEAATMRWQQCRRQLDEDMALLRSELIRTPRGVTLLLAVRRLQLSLAGPVTDPDQFRTTMTLVRPQASTFPRLLSSLSSAQAAFDANVERDTCVTTILDLPSDQDFEVLSHLYGDSFVAAERQADRFRLIAGLIPGVALLAVWVLLRLTRNKEELAARVVLRTNELRQSETHLQRVTHQQEQILASAQDGIFSLDPDGRCILVNPAAASLLGHSMESLEGRTMHTLVHTQGDHSAEACPLLVSLSILEPQAARQDIFARADGRQFPVEYSTAVLLESEGPSGVVVVFRDISVRREVDLLKDEFISVVSHELRTPLASLKGSLGLLKTGLLGDLNDKGKRMVQLAANNTDRLVRLIDNIMDVEKLRSGSVPLTKSTLHASEVARSVVNSLQAMADEKGIVLKLHTGNVQVLADPDRLAQALSNLVENAIKFSSPGTEVGVHIEQVDNVGQFSVTDHGSGIPPDKLDRLFRWFQQVDGSDSRDKGGTGLGLAIVRAIVVRHGGHIWVESMPGVGTTFFFTIPLE